MWREFGVTLCQYALQQKDEADQGLKAMINAYSKEGPYQIAEIYAFRGDHDKAFHWLEVARQERDGGLTQLLGSRLLKPLHDDSRWPEFLDAMGLADSAA